MTNDAVLVVSDIDGTALRELSNFDLEAAFGEDENEISVVCDASEAPSEGQYVHIDGSDVIGTIDEVTADTTTSEVECKGRTAHGILQGKILVPDSGKSHITVSGQVDTVLTSLITRMGLSELFSAAENSTRVSYTFERFVDGYTGLTAMLKANNMRPRFRWSDGGIVIHAEEIETYGDAIDSDLIDFEVTVVGRRTNHLVCGGTGEDADRTIIHFYADSKGNVSKKQSLFGVDEIAAFYDYSNADEEKLDEEGREKLEEMQSEGTVSVTVSGDQPFVVGDVVTGRDNRTGVAVTVEIVKDVVTVSGGVLSHEYEAGVASSSTSANRLSGSGESTAGGHAYYAGDGLTLENYTFSADVTQDDFNELSDDLTEVRKTASDASALAATSVQGVTATSPISASRDGQSVALSHASSGVTAGSYGPTANAEPGFGDTVTVGQRVSVNASGHVTSMAGRTVKIPDDVATSDADGLMSVADKAVVDALPDTYAAKGHSHSAGDVTSGTLPIARGGTGKTASKAAQNALLSDMAEVTADASDEGYFVGGYVSPTDSTGALFKRKGSTVWAWIKAKADQLYAAVSHSHVKADITDFPTSMKSPAALTISLNGTSQGAYDGSAAKSVNVTASAIGAAASSHTHTGSQVTGLTASRALVSTSAGAVGVSDVTATELGYLDGVTSGIQAQLDAKAASSHTHNYAGSSSAGGAATTALACTGNAATATKLATARTISLSGDASGSGSFDGSANLAIVATVLHHGQTAIPSSANLNSYTDPGWYHCAANATAATLTNCPTANAFALAVLTHAGTCQVLVEYMSGSHKVYHRNLYSGTWGSWCRLYTTVDAPTSVSGNAGTATKLATARAIQTNLASTSSASFDGSANVTPGVTGTLPIANGGTGNTTGKAASATKLATARTITLTGAVKGSASFDGSANVTITTEGQETAASFLAAHPVGSYFETSSTTNPGKTYGGTWSQVRGCGPVVWHRTA